jgi:hypothetical protein
MRFAEPPSRTAVQIALPGTGVYRGSSIDGVEVR